MSTRLEAELNSQLSQVQDRIAEIEAEYPKIIRIKSYSRNFQGTQTAYQDFGDVAKEYHALLDRKLSICGDLDSIEASSVGSHQAYFRKG